MVGKNPIVLVGTKLDLLPEGTHPRDVAGALKSALLVGDVSSVNACLCYSHPPSAGGAWIAEWLTLLSPTLCWGAWIAEWLTEAATRKRLNVVSCHLVSSHSGEGVSLATGKICRERKGRDVYVIGAANVSRRGIFLWNRSIGCKLNTQI